VSKARRAAHHEEEGHGNSERWLLTYSDMITLLMVLFIVLFALGQTDIRKFNAFKDSFRGVQLKQTPGPLTGGQGVLQNPKPIQITSFAPHGAASDSQAAARALQSQQEAQAADTTEHQALLKAEQQMQQALQQAGLATDVTFGFDPRGLVITVLTDGVLFPLDSAQLQPQGIKIILAIGPVLASLPNQIDVEGNTDNQAIHGGPYADNWALSSARAVAVVERLITTQNVPATRLEATGNADTRPIVPNNSPSHQAENRRVEIVVFSTTVTPPN
jgi:chemotaxis protein MotB